MKTNPASTLKKPVVIPPEILTLKNVKLPEKLALAMFAADPATSPVRRVLSLTGAGLRKLKRRLYDKGLLTVAGDRHMVHVPGLVYIDHPEGGHFVSNSSTTKNEKKVARPVSKTAQADLRPLVVPAELVAFQYLTASEKVLLSYYIASPGAQNQPVIETLGISRAGLKKLKSRLLEKRVLIQTADGCTMRLPGLVLLRDSDGGHFIRETEAVKNGHKVAHPAPKLTPAMDVYNRWKAEDKAMHGQPGLRPSDSLDCTTARIRQIEEESPEGPEREAVLSEMKEAENFYFAQDFIYKNTQKYLALIDSATPEQLVTLREKAERMMLAGIPEPKLLGMVSKVISH